MTNRKIVEKAIRDEIQNGQRYWYNVRNDLMIWRPTIINDLGDCPKFVTVRCPFCDVEFYGIVNEPDTCSSCHHIYRWEIVDGKREAVFDE